jgi:FixJ family two-component response regulator
MLIKMTDQSTPELPIGAGAEGTVIAVIDSDRSVLAAVGRLLRAHGFGVEGFASVEAFLARERRAEPACLVLDVDLGGTSGFSLMHCLAAGDAPLPVIVVTATEEEGTRRRAYAAGCVAYLRKPFSAAALIAAIETATRPRSAISDQ